MARVTICAAEELLPGSVRVADASGHELAVFNVAGRLHAVRNRCPHHGAPLAAGRVGGTMLPSAPHEYRYGRDGEILRCPWHGYEFELESGHCLIDSERLRVKVYPVAVEDGVVVVEV
jgi:nitrite reductase (NADH) small subunit